MAIEQISGFPWSARVENALRQVMEQSNGENDHSVLTTAARFGPQAAALIPLFIEYASAPRRSGGSSAFVREFRAIGGDDRQLLNALVDRLEGVELPANPHSSSAPPPRRLPGSVWMDFWWLTDIGLRDERGAAAIKPFMRPGSTMPDASDPAVAYAVLSGDRTAATQFLLEFKPDFTQPLFLGSPQYTTFELLRRQLADQDLIIAHFVETDDISRRRGLATVLSTYMASHILAEYEPILQRLANDPDDATATAAKRALQKLAPK